MDDETLQKYVRPYQNGLGVDYMKLWQRIEIVQASSSTYPTEHNLGLNIKLFIAQKILFIAVIFVVC